MIGGRDTVKRAIELMNKEVLEGRDEFTMEAAVHAAGRIKGIALLARDLLATMHSTDCVSYPGNLMRSQQQEVEEAWNAADNTLFLDKRLDDGTIIRLS